MYLTQYTQINIQGRISGTEAKSVKSVRLSNIILVIYQWCCAAGISEELFFIKLFFILFIYFISFFSFSMGE